MAAHITLTSGVISIYFDNHVKNTCDATYVPTSLVKILAVDGDDEIIVTFPVASVISISYSGNAVFADFFNWTDIDENVVIRGEQLQLVKYGDCTATVDAISTGYVTIADYGPGLTTGTSDSPYTYSYLNIGSLITATGTHDSVYKQTSNTNMRKLPTQKIVGFNLCAQYPDLSGSDPWSNMYANWSSASIYLKEQIDVATTWGGNCFRLIGNTNGITTSVFTRAHYLSCIRDIVSYCQHKGVFWYGCTDSVQQINQSVSMATNSAESAEYCRTIAEYPNVIGCDLIQETNLITGSYTYPTYLATLFPACRAAAPNLPMSCSFVPFTSGDFTDSTYASACLSFADYADFHTYYTSPSSSNLDSFIAANPTIPVIIAEFGMNATEGDRTSRMTGYMGMVNRSDVAGGMAWATRFELPLGTNLYGAWLNDSTPLLDYLTPMSSGTQRPAVVRSAHRRRSLV